MNADVVYLNGSLWYEFLNFSFIKTLAVHVVVNGNKHFELEIYIDTNPIFPPVKWNTTTLLVLAFY